MKSERVLLKADQDGGESLYASQNNARPSWVGITSGRGTIDFPCRVFVALAGGY